MGLLIGSNQLFSGFDFAWFQAVCEEKLGKRHIRKILKQESVCSEQVQAYMNAMEKQQAEWDGLFFW